jgi:anti-sigma factor RsiW
MADLLQRFHLPDKPPPPPALYTPEVRHPVEVTAAEEEHLVNWLSKASAIGCKCPHLSTLGYELVGGRPAPGRTRPRGASSCIKRKNGQRLTSNVKTDLKAQRETAFRFAQEGKR